MPVLVFVTIMAWHKNTGIPIAWIKNAGHNSNTDAPEEVNSLIEKLINKI